MEDLSPSDILAIFKRRRKLFIVTTGALLILSILFTLNWSRHRAVATVGIEQSNIAHFVTDIGKGSATNETPELADRRINLIEQKVTSVDALMHIIKTLNLYPGINDKLPPQKVASIMRRSIHLKFVSGEVANPAAPSKESVDQLSAIAFTLSFDYNNPRLAKDALDMLVSRFIQEEQKLRIGQSKATKEFLAEQLKQLEAGIGEQEKKVAQFRAKYGDSGAASLMFNQQASMSSNMTLQTIESQMSTIEATIGTLRGQLATTDSHLPTVEDGKTINTPRGQLNSLTAQLASLTGRYGPDHPDVVKVRTQLEQLKAGGKGLNLSTEYATAPDNPTYLQVSAQLSAAQGQLKGLVAQREALKAQREKYERLIAANPEIEQQASQLTLDLDNAKERYRTLKDKMLAASMRETLESDASSQRLTVISPALVPEGTHPRRALLLTVGMLMSLLGGIGLVGLVETMSQGIRGANHLASIVGAPPLVTIAHISQSSQGASHG